MTRPLVVSSAGPTDAVRSRWLIRCLVVLAVLACLTRLCTPLLRDDLVPDDYHQHVWWYQDVSDPGLYAGNYPFKYFSSAAFSPPLYHWIMLGFSATLGPIPGAVLMSVLAAVASALLLWRLGTRFTGDRVGGWAALVAWLAFPSVLKFRLLDGLGHVDDGLPRSFALPLLLAFLYFLLERRMVALGLTILVAALCYPVLGLPMFGVLALVFCYDVRLARRIPAAWFTFSIIGIIASIAFVVFHHRLPAEFGPTVDLATAKTMATFQPGGRSVFFYNSLYDQIISSQRCGFKAGRPDVVVIGLALALACWLGMRIRRFEIKAMLLSACSSWAVSYIFAFHLYLPGRHLRYVAYVCIVLMVAVLVTHVIRRLADRVSVRPWAICGLSWVILVQGCWTVSAVRRQPDEHFVAIIKDIVSLPRAAVVAAHPIDADPIPMFGRHPVPLSMEMFLPFHLGYFRRMEAEGFALARVLRAEHFDVAMAYGASHGVSFLLVDERRAATNDRFLDHLFPEDGPKRPDDSPGSVSRWYADVSRSVPEQRIVSRRGPWTIVDIRP